MRYITVPEPFKLEDRELGEVGSGKHPEIDFSAFIRKWLVSHPDVTKKPALFREIDAMFKGVKPGVVVEMESDPWEWFSNIARATNYPTEVKFYALAHVEAITEAPSKDPRKKPVEAVEDADEKKAAE